MRSTGSCRRCDGVLSLFQVIIAEGKGRSTHKDMNLFLCHARGSVHELETQLFIAEQLGYIQVAEAERVMSDVGEVARMLNGLISFAASA